jgi:hypothetical protein
MEYLKVDVISGDVEGVYLEEREMIRRRIKVLVDSRFIKRW